MTLRDILKKGERQFKAAKLYFGHGTNNAWDEAVFLASHVLKLSPDTDRNVLDRKLTTLEQKKILSLFKKRITKQIPAPYLVKEAWFSGLPFYVDERVLIPRSSLGELIENKFASWTQNLKVKKILDIGTGSGCIAIASALAFPKAKIDALDISDEALSVAKMNVKNYKVTKRVRLIKSDLFTKIPNEVYDIIISNPPYVSKAELKHLPKEYSYEPKLGLAAGIDGLDIVTKILAAAKKHLTKNGLLIVEVGNREKDLEKHFPNTPFIWLQFQHAEGGVFLLTKRLL